MKRFIPIEKMSKKAQQELHKVGRRGWGELSPVTRKAPNPKAYLRKKARREGKNFDAGSF